MFLKNDLQAQLDRPRIIDLRIRDEAERRGFHAGRDSTQSVPITDIESGSTKLDKSLLAEIEVLEGCRNVFTLVPRVLPIEQDVPRSVLPNTPIRTAG